MLSQSRSGLSAPAQWAINPDLPSSDIVVQMSGASITRSNIRRLLNGQANKDMFLDDTLIHFYLARLMERSTKSQSFPKFT